MCRETPAAAKPKSKEAPATEKIKHVEKYSSLLESLNKNWSDMRLKKLKKITPMTFLITSKYITDIYYMEYLSLDSFIEI